MALEKDVEALANFLGLTADVPEPSATQLAVDSRGNVAAALGPSPLTLTDKEAKGLFDSLNQAEPGDPIPELTIRVNDWDIILRRQDGGGLATVFFGVRSGDQKPVAVRVIPLSYDMPGNDFF